MALEDDIEQGLILDTEKSAPEIVRRYIKKYRELYGPNAKRNIARSNQWFMRRISKDVRLSRQSVFEQFRQDSRKRKPSDRGIIGRMMLFKYDALHKDTLPVWDSYPLVFFFNSFTGNGTYGENGVRYVLGLNVHYLPSSLRLKLFVELIKFNTDTALREKSRLKLEWQFLKAFSASNLAKHCVKMYRADHIKSELMEISPRFWEVVLFLNIQKWEKGSNALAWKGATR